MHFSEIWIKTISDKILIGGNLDQIPEPELCQTKMKMILPKWPSYRDY